MAPHLVLFFTRATSLQAWDEVGIFNRETALYERLAERGFRVTFVTYGGRTDRELAKQLTGIRVVCNEWNLPERTYRELLTTVYPLRWGRHAIFKSNQVKGAEVALRAARRFRRTFVARCGYLLSQFSTQEHGRDSRQTQAALELEQTVFRAATRLSVTTSEMARRVVEAYGIDPSRISVVPNHVDTQLFSPPCAAASPSDAIGGGRRKPRLVFVGRLIAQKNLPALFKAIAGLDAELLVVGNDVLYDELLAIVTARHLPVTFLGNVPNAELPRVLHGADLFVLPSLYEGHPKALLEAMACGLPVIGTDVTGIRGLIRHGETGWLTGTAPSELRAGIESLLRDADLRKRLGRAARDFVASRYSLARILDAEVELLNLAVAAHLRGPARSARRAERREAPASRPLG